MILMRSGRLRFFQCALDAREQFVKLRHRSAMPRCRAVCEGYADAAAGKSRIFVHALNGGGIRFIHPSRENGRSIHDPILPSARIMRG